MVVMEACGCSCNYIAGVTSITYKEEQVLEMINNDKQTYKEGLYDLDCELVQYLSFELPKVIAY